MAWEQLIGPALGLLSALGKKGGQQQVGGQPPQIPNASTTIQSQPEMTKLQPLGQQMMLNPTQDNESAGLKPSSLSDILGQAGGWMQDHPLMTAGIGAGAMGLATRGNPDAMLAGGAIANALARRKKRPVIGG